MAYFAICARHIAETLDEIRASGKVNAFENAFETECLRLLLRLVKELPYCTVITDSIPSLARYLENSVRRLTQLRIRSESTPKSLKHRTLLALKSLKHILIEGSRDHKIVVIEEGVIPSLKRLLSESLDEILTKDSNNSLKTIIRYSIAALRAVVDLNIKEHRKSVVAGGVLVLLRLLHTHGDTLVASVKGDTLVVLAAISNVATFNSGELDLLLPRLGCKSIPKDELSCSELLRNVLKGTFPPIQHVIQSSILPWVLSVIQTSTSVGAQTNLADVVLILTGGTCEQIAILVKNHGIVSILIGLQDSPCGDIKEKAISALHNIANSVGGSGVVIANDSSSSDDSSGDRSSGEFEYL